MKEEKEEDRKYRKDYDQNNLYYGMYLVKNENKNPHNAANVAGVPYTTLRRYMQGEDTSIRKLGRPYNLSSDLESQLYNYFVEMKELGFGVTVLKARKSAYDLFEKQGEGCLLPSENRLASKWWWNNFKTRHNFCLRVPESLSSYRSSLYCKNMVNDFFRKLDELLTKLDIKDKPHLIWNCDSTGLAYVVKPSGIVTGIGKKYAYRAEYVEEAETQTMLFCVGGDGTVLAPMIKFNGDFLYDSFGYNALPNALIKVSPNGWIDTDLFLEWFRYFILSIPQERPVVLLMESHSAHIGPEVLKLAKDQQIYFCTFPVHCTHVLQPLDQVVKTLKNYWQESLTKYMSHNPLFPPRHDNFHYIFNPAFINSFTGTNIKEAFNKTGIYPLNAHIVYQALPEEVLEPSVLTYAPEPGSSTTQELRDIITSDSMDLGEFFQTPEAPEWEREIDYSACVTPLRDEEVDLFVESLPSCSTSKSITEDDDWRCGLCDGSYSMDVRKKKGIRWIQCSYCLIPYHKKCVTLLEPEFDEELYFRCDNCM